MQIAGDQMILEPIIQTLYQFKEKKLAIDVLEAFYKNAFHFEQYDELAKCAFRIKEYKLAIEYGETALANALKPEQMWVARSNLINVYNHANYPEKAMRLIIANENVIPNDKDTRLEKAFSLYLLGKRDEAEAIIRAELLKPDLSEDEHTKLRFNLGTYELYRDNFLYGLELLMIEGRKMGLWPKQSLPGEYWMGQPAEGKQVFILAEAGIGDELINIRFMKDLEARGIIPIWYTEREDLYRIYQKNGYRVTNTIKDYKEGMLWAKSMLLPLYLEMSYETLWKGPYLKASQEYIDKAAFIKSTKGLKIGLRWQGNPEYDQDLHRSVPLKEIAEVLPRENSYFSIQRDNGLEELDGLDFITDLSDDLKTFEHTLGIIENLDVVITSCTSVAHAAASIGKKTFVFVPLSAYYTWSHSTEKSPWYGDNVVILRQTKTRDWAEPIAKLQKHLKEL